MVGNLLASIDPDLIEPTPLGGLVFLIMVLVVVGGVVFAVVLIVRAVRAGRTRGRWYPDPDGSGRFRWHNGQKWTDTYTDDPSQPPAY